MGSSLSEDGSWGRSFGPHPPKVSARALVASAGRDADRSGFRIVTRLRPHLHRHRRLPQVATTGAAVAETAIAEHGLIADLQTAALFDYGRQAHRTDVTDLRSAVVSPVAGEAVRGEGREAFLPTDLQGGVAALPVDRGVDERKRPWR